MGFFLWLGLLIIFIFLMVFTYTWLSAGPYTPIQYSYLERIFEQIDFSENDVFYDLGAGDGRVIMHVASKYHIRSVGYEINFFLVAYIRGKLFISRLSNCHVVYQSLFSADLSKATIVFIHVLPHAARSLVDKLNRELPSGARIISYGIDLPGLKFEKTLKAGSGVLAPTEAYLYQPDKSEYLSS